MAVDLDHIRRQWAARRRNGILCLTRKADRPDDFEDALEEAYSRAAKAKELREGGTATQPEKALARVGGSANGLSRKNVTDSSGHEHAGDGRFTGPGGGGSQSGKKPGGGGRQPSGETEAKKDNRSPTMAFMDDVGDLAERLRDGDGDAGEMVDQVEKHAESASGKLEAYVDSLLDHYHENWKAVYGDDILATDTAKNALKGFESSMREYQELVTNKIDYVKDAFDNLSSALGGGDQDAIDDAETAFEQANENLEKERKYFNEMSFAAIKDAETDLNYAVEQRDETWQSAAQEQADTLNNDYDDDSEGAAQTAEEINRELAEADNPYRVERAEDGEWFVHVPEEDEDEPHSAKSFDESKHPRGQPGNAGEFAPASGGGGKKPKPGKPAKKPAPQEEESHPGAAHGSEVKVKLTKERAAPRNARGKIDPIPVQTQLSKQETGRVAEAGIRAYLRDIEGISDTVALNAGKTNESIDLFGDSMAPEVKGGLCSNSVKAQQWRITFSMELGAKEQAEYDALSPVEQKAWREKRQRACLERKLSLLKKISKERGKKINPVTYTGIVNPDKRTIDIYKTDGYHQRLDWNDPKAKYVASVQYDHAPGDSGSSKSFYRRKGWVTLEPSGTHVYIDGDSGEITAGPPHLTGRKPSELVRERVGKQHGEKHPVTGEPGPKKPPTPEEESPDGFHEEASEEGPKKAKFGKSKAKVEVSHRDKQEAVEKKVQELFGGRVKTEDISSLVGAPDDAVVTVERINGFGGVQMVVKVNHPAYTAIRHLGKKGDKTFIKNEEFWVKDEAQGKGLGTEVFGRQVENAVEMGVDYIACHAAKENPRDPDTPHNGYYTWPRFGYDQSLEDFDEFDAAEFRLKKAIRKNFPEAKSILDVMATPAGRDWWKKNGDDLHLAKFDLSEGSRSRKVFDAYLEERAARPTKKAGFDMTTKADEPEDDNPHVEEIELSEEDEAALDRAWEKLDAETEGE